MHTGRTDPVTGPDWMPITRKRGPYSVPIHNSGEAPRPNPQRPLALAAGTALRAPIGTRDPSGALVGALVNVTHDRGDEQDPLSSKYGPLSAVRAEGYTKFLGSRRLANRVERTRTNMSVGVP
jgi:hypothetical protein